MNHTSNLKKSNPFFFYQLKENKRLATGYSHYMMERKLQIICKQHTTKNSSLDHLLTSVALIFVVRYEIRQIPSVQLETIWKGDKHELRRM